MQKKKLFVRKTARYFTLGNGLGTVHNVWFIFHGYGQTADQFISRFNTLDEEKNLIIAPEGLNRFYTEGFDGRVGASWMTTVDREDDIADYLCMLDKVYEDALPGIQAKSQRINLLGFSQGTATACRWFVKTKHKIDRLILWAGFCPDLCAAKRMIKYRRTELYFIAGKEDRIIDREELSKQIRILSSAGCMPELIKYPGGHHIDRKTLNKLAVRFWQGDE